MMFLFLTTIVNSDQTRLKFGSQNILDRSYINFVDKKVLIFETSEKKELIETMNLEEFRKKYKIWGEHKW